MNSLTQDVLSITDGHIRTQYSESCRRGIRKRNKKSRKPWIDEETLGLMDERKRYKNIGDKQGKTHYKKLRNEVQRRFR